MKLLILRLVCLFFGHHPKRPISYQGQMEHSRCTDCGAPIQRQFTIPQTKHWKTER